MTTERDPQTRIVLSWLREDAHENAERVLLRALDEVDTTRQRRSWWPARRFHTLNTSARIGLGAAAAIALAIAGIAILRPASDVGPTNSPTPSLTPSLSPSPTSNPLAGTWQGTEVTCAQQVATIEAAGYTDEQVIQAGADLAAEGIPVDPFFDPTCATPGDGGRTTNQYSLVFDGLPAAATVLSARVYDYDQLASPHMYRLADGSTFELGARTGQAWEWCITVRYGIDGEQLTIETIDPSCAGAPGAPLLDQIALTAILETSSFTRQP
jgi:hypothetical protein